MTTFDYYEVHGTSQVHQVSIDIKWQIVERNSWAYCVMTDNGEFWLENSHIEFSNNKVEIKDDNLDNYIAWLMHQCDNELNYYCLIEKDSDSIDTRNAQYFWYEVFYNNWCDDAKIWKVLAKKRKKSLVPNSLVRFNKDQQLIAPYWVIVKSLPRGSRFAPLIYKNINSDLIKKELMFNN